MNARLPKGKSTSRFNSRKIGGDGDEWCGLARVILIYNNEDGKRGREREKEREEREREKEREIERERKRDRERERERREREREGKREREREIEIMKYSVHYLISFLSSK